MCLHVQRHTFMHVCKHMHIYIHLPGTATSSLQPLKRGGKEAECHISFLSKQAMSFLLRVGRGWSVAMTGLGKEPLWSIFHRHPRQNCCQKHCLISFLTAGLDSPHKEGHCILPCTLGICSAEIRWETQRGDLGNEGTASCATTFRRVTNS